MKTNFQTLKAVAFLLFLSFFGLPSANAQNPCRIKFNATHTPNSSNPFLYAFNAFSPDSNLSFCFSANTIFNWQIGNYVTSGQSVSYNFPGHGIYGVCVTAQTSMGNTVAFCDTIILDSTSNPQNCSISYTSQPGDAMVPFNFDFIPVLNGSANCFPPGTVYTWTWSGPSMTTATTTYSPVMVNKVFPGPGKYLVCLRAAVQGATPFLTCDSIIVGNQPQTTIHGLIQANNTCLLNSPVLVELISLTDSEQRATVLTNPDSCYYWFTVPAQPVRNWIVKATPLQTNAFMPTYLGDVIFYSDATVFSTNPQGQSNPVLNLVPNFWGDSINWDSTSNPFFGRVSGTITGNGTTIVSTLGNYNLSTIFNASKAVVLILNAQNKPIGFAKVNADGTFTTPNLPPGQYSLRVEAPKVPSQSVPFTITAGSNVQINFNATGSGINTVTSVNKTINSSELSIYPNPANDKISLKGVTGSVKIIDTKGQTVLETASTSNIEIAKLPSGLYTITGLNKANKVISARFVKN